MLAPAAPRSPVRQPGPAAPTSNDSGMPQALPSGFSPTFESAHRSHMPARMHKCLEVRRAAATARQAALSAGQGQLFCA